MKNLMESILSIDKQQDDRLSEMLKKKEQALLKIDQEVTALQKQMHEQAESHLLKMKACEEQETKQVILNIQTQLERDKQQLKDTYNKYEKQWVAMLLYQMTQYKTPTL